MFRVESVRNHLMRKCLFVVVAFLVIGQTIGSFEFKSSCCLFALGPQHRPDDLHLLIPRPSGSSAKCPVQVRADQLPDGNREEFESRFRGLDLADSEPDTIAGKIVDSDRSIPLTGAKVTLLVSSPSLGFPETARREFIQKTVSDQNGSFEFRDLQSKCRTKKFEKYFILFISKPSFASLTRGVINTTDGESSSELTIALEPGASIAGAITDFEENPISGATFSRTGWNTHFSVESDMAGQFELNDIGPYNSPVEKTGLPIYSTFYTVAHPDYGQFFVPMSKIPNHLEIRLQRGVKVRGRIVFEKTGEPVPDCRLVVVTQKHLPVHSHQIVESESDGKFEFTLLAGIDFRVNVHHPNWLFRTKLIDGKESGTSLDLGDLKLVEPVLVAGKVIDEDTDTPIQNSNIRVAWHGPDCHKSDLARSCKVQADGSFTAPMCPGSNYPYIQSPDWELTYETPKQSGIEITR